MKSLHIDLETFSSVDLKTSGVYKYQESIDFEILLIAYAYDDEPINIVDLLNGEQIPEDFIRALLDDNIQKHAHNATFERLAFQNIGFKTSASVWHCSMVKAAYCGLPLSLEQVSKALKLEEKGKLSTGKALIKYFCEPCKPTKVNGGRTRNMPHHAPEKWEEFKRYCMSDVEAERGVERILSSYKIPFSEKEIYLLDQKINDRGIEVDLGFAKNAQEMDAKTSGILQERLKQITGVDNPNSPAQLKKWLTGQTGREIESLAKDSVEELLKEIESGPVTEVLKLRQKSSKTSTKKYAAMLASNCDDGRSHGLFQFYGANRTGRWAGRLIQLQNLPQNHIKELELAREVVASGDYDLANMLYDDMSSIISQLIRTAFVAKKGHTFAVADFSAIEARVIAWLAEENWRLKVFRSHGKIYEASAALMFGIPIENITKGSDLRAKGKVAELALGYGGSVGALTKMGGEKMGLSETEMKAIVRKWRKANPRICELWGDLEGCAMYAVKTGKSSTSVHRGLVFEYDGTALTIQLPSGRKLFYWKPTIGKNRFGSESIEYRGMDQTTKQWTRIDTYGGKITENVVQAIARDILAEAMLRLDKADFSIVMHVHDENIAEVDNTGGSIAEKELKRMCEIMSEPVKWAEGLPLAADGYVTPFYKKD